MTPVFYDEYYTEQKRAHLVWEGGLTTLPQGLSDTTIPQPNDLLHTLLKDISELCSLARSVIPECVPLMWNEKNPSCLVSLDGTQSIILSWSYVRHFVYPIVLFTYAICDYHITEMYSTLKSSYIRRQE